MLPGIIIAWLMYTYRWEILQFFVNENIRTNFFSDVATTMQDLLTLTFGILVEAIPFVILGVSISVIIKLFVSTEFLFKYLPKNKSLRHLCVSFFGVLMPVCECGNVPVARTLIMKGFSTREAIIFLLAAPSVNIITFLVTWEVFSQNHGVAVTRVIATVVIANIVAYLVTKLIADKNILTDDFVAACSANAHTPKTLRGAATMFRSEMWLITRLLVIGALIAAATQTIIPREIITAIGQDVFLSVLAMILLAFVISICSSVDSFFALAYVNTFSLGSILAFLVAGPMVDIKMLALMKTTFTVRALSLIAGSVFVLTFMLGVIFSYVW
jgi:uncharacterized protein